MRNDSRGTVSRAGTRSAVAAAVLVVLIIGTLYTRDVYRLVGGAAVLAIYDLTNVTLALLSTWLASLLWRSFQRGETLSFIWGFLTIGLAMWSAGEIIWSSDQLLFGNKLPYPSAADVLWLLGYVPVILALAVRLFTFRMRLTKPFQFIILAAYVVGVIFAIAYVVIPVLTESQGVTQLEVLVTAAYPVGDLIVAFFALLLVLVLSGGLLFGPWGLIALGYFGFAASDLFYALAILDDVYQVDPAAGLNFMSYSINLLYTAAYVLVALGLYQSARLQNAA